MVFLIIMLFSTIFDGQNIDGQPPVLLETVERENFALHLICNYLPRSKNCAMWYILSHYIWPNLLVLSVCVVLECFQYICVL